MIELLGKILFGIVDALLNVAIWERLKKYRRHA